MCLYVCLFVFVCMLLFGLVWFALLCFDLLVRPVVCLVGCVLVSLSVGSLVS